MFKKISLSILALGLLLGTSLLNTPSQAREDGMCWCGDERRNDLETKQQCEETACPNCRAKVCHWNQAQNY